MTRYRPIQEIAMLGCGSEDKRRSEIIRSVRILDDLADELKKQGFALQGPRHEKEKGGAKIYSY